MGEGTGHGVQFHVYLCVSVCAREFFVVVVFGGYNVLSVPYNAIAQEITRQFQ